MKKKTINLSKACFATPTFLLRFVWLNDPLKLYFWCLCFPLRDPEGICVKITWHLGFIWLEEWIWENGFEGIWVDCGGKKRLFGLRDGW